ncbi:hypothetical protein ACFSX9_01210 [Flavobacterium ardleyense]|uniref:Lipoprotein n=1 Tax=Flavobacterium ardleyense TaxID=2038737 RepID=A0ABW5Z3K5_9FLAO
MKLFVSIILLGLLGCKSKSELTYTTINHNFEKNDIQDSLAFELCQIYGFDQGIRDFNLKFNKREVMPAIDSLNFAKVANFVKSYGFPTEELVGEKNLDRECVLMAVPAVLLHNPHRLVNEEQYFNLFFNEVKKNNIEPSFFASILDKYYWVNSKNKKTRRVFYGSEFGKPCLQTKEATNKARIEIGLKPLQDNGFVDCEGEDLNMPKERR